MCKMINIREGGQKKLKAAQNQTCVSQDLLLLLMLLLLNIT